MHVPGKHITGKPRSSSAALGHHHAAPYSANGCFGDSAWLAGGRIDFIAIYGGYLGEGEDAYPGQIQVERPWEELIFRFDLTEADRDPSIPTAAFRFAELPPGYRVLTIQEAMAESRRSGGS